MVLSGHQLAGRGRGSNTWWSASGSLTATFVLAADQHLAAHHVPLIAGLAVRAAAAELCGDDQIQLKWPNDLLHDGRKLAGLLCERVDQADLIGVGMNVNIRRTDVPANLRESITSLNAICGRKLDMNIVLATIARHLHSRLRHRDEQSFAAVMREYDRHHALVGRNVTVIGSANEPPIRGRCEGLDQMGRLLIRDRRTLHHVIAGRVER